MMIFRMKQTITRVANILWQISALQALSLQLLSKDHVHPALFLNQDKIIA